MMHPLLRLFGCLALFETTQARSWECMTLTQTPGLCNFTNACLRLWLYPQQPGPMEMLRVRHGRWFEYRLRKQQLHVNKCRYTSARQQCLVYDYQNVPTSANWSFSHNYLARPPHNDPHNWAFHETFTGDGSGGFGAGPVEQVRHMVQVFDIDQQRLKCLFCACPCILWVYVGLCVSASNADTLDTDSNMQLPLLTAPIGTVVDAAGRCILQISVDGSTVTLGFELRKSSHGPVGGSAMVCGGSGVGQHARIIATSGERRTMPLFSHCSTSRRARGGWRVNTLPDGNSRVQIILATLSIMDGSPMVWNDLSRRDRRQQLHRYVIVWYFRSKTQPACRVTGTSPAILAGVVSF